MRPHQPLKKKSPKVNRSYADFHPHYDALKEYAGSKRNRFNTSDGAELNPIDMGRRQLYESLPFTAVIGMQFRENHLNDDISKSMSGLNLAAGLPGSIDAEKIIDPGTLTASLMFAVMISAVSTFLAGYHTGCMNPIEEVVFPGHTTIEWSLAVSIFAIGGPVGAMYGGFAANHYGRKGAIIVNGAGFLVAGALLALAPGMHWLVVGRLLAGAASGFTCVVVPIYLGELAPPTLRGTLGTLTQFSFCVGILASYLMAFPFSESELGWRLLLGATAVLAAAQLAAAPALLVETPRWLLAHVPDEGARARAALAALRGFPPGGPALEKEVGHMQSAMAVHATRHASAHSGSAVGDLLADPRLRPLVVSMIVVHAGQQLCGINAVFYYSNMFFDGVIEDPLVGTCLAGAINVFGVWVALRLMDRMGRKRLLVISGAGMLAGCACLTLALMGAVPNIVALFAVMSYVTFFEIGFGPIPWLIVAEMFDAKYVATAQSVAVQVNWFFNFVVGLTFPSISEALGPYSFGPFAALTLAAAAFCHWRLPETAGKAPDEVAREAARVWGGGGGGGDARAVLVLEASSKTKELNSFTAVQHLKVNSNLFDRPSREVSHSIVDQTIPEDTQA